MASGWPSPSKSQASRTIVARRAGVDVEVKVTGSPAVGAAGLYSKFAVKPSCSCADAEPANPGSANSARSAARTASEAAKLSLRALRRFDTVPPVVPCTERRG